MKIVTANFYFKDGTVLNVTSDTGVYNNKTLDMLFQGNVKADYIERTFCRKSRILKFKKFFNYIKNVVIKDKRGQ